MMRILVGVITLGRPRMLARLLESLWAQRLDDPGIQVSVLVVDNDPGRSAEAVVDEAARAAPFPVRYEVEPRRGIPFARNHVLERALALDVGHVVFIDDDETAPPHWLAELVHAFEQHGADAVQGPVRYVPAPGGPEWMAAELAHRSERMLRRPEGSVKSKLSTRNVLFSIRLARELGLRFDPRYALSGGSDIDFFHRAHTLGARTLWTNRAVVDETIPVERQALGFQVRRAYRAAAGTTYSRRIHRGWGPTALRILPKGLTRLVDGVLRLVLFGAFSPRMRLYALRRIAGGVGHFTGLFGILGSQYGTIQGH